MRCAKEAVTLRLLDRVRVLLTGQLPEAKQDAVGATVTVLPGQPRFPSASFGQFAEGGYKKNELVYACIQEIATSASEAPLRVYDVSEDQVLVGHPLRL